MGDISKDKITCQIDGAQTHSIPNYLRNTHPEWTIERYKETYPDAPLYSDVAQAKIREIQAAKTAAPAAKSATEGAATIDGVTRLGKDDVFSLAGAKDA